MSNTRSEVFNLLIFYVNTEEEKRLFKEDSGRLRFESKVKVGEIFEILHGFWDKGWERFQWNEILVRHSAKKDESLLFSSIYSMEANCISNFLSWLFSGHSNNSKKSPIRWTHILKWILICSKVLILVFKALTKFWDDSKLTFKLRKKLENQLFKKNWNDSKWRLIALRFWRYRKKFGERLSSPFPPKKYSLVDK